MSSTTDTKPMNTANSIVGRLDEIEAECKYLEIRIAALSYQGEADLEVAALKRKRSKLNEEFIQLRDNLLPGIIA